MGMGMQPQMGMGMQQELMREERDLERRQGRMVVEEAYHCAVL